MADSLKGKDSTKLVVTDEIIKKGSVHAKRTVRIKRLHDDLGVNTAKMMKGYWLAVKARFGGNDESKKMRKSMLKQEFSEFKEHFTITWLQVAITLKIKGGLDYLSFDDLYNKLRTLEISRGTSAPTHSAFISAASTTSKMSYLDQFHLTTFTSTSSSPYYSSNDDGKMSPSFLLEMIPPTAAITYEDFDQIGKLDLEELDIKWQMAMLSVRIKDLKKKAGRKMSFTTRCCKVLTRRRYSSFKLKELDKTEEPKALLSVDSMLNSSDHEGEDVENGAAQVYATSIDVDDVSNAAAEFALMGISSQVQTCPFGCEHLYAELKKEFDNVEVQYKECYIQVQAYKSTLQTLEQQKGWYQSNQLALEERIRILTANLENTTNMLKYTEKLNEQAKLEKMNDKVQLEESKARFDKWKDSSKNLDKLIHSSMSSRSKFGLGFGETFGSDEVFDPSGPSIFDTTPDDVAEKPLYDRFVKAVGMHVVPPPLTGTFMPPSNNPDLDDTQFTYGSKSNNCFETNSVSNDFVSCDNSDKSSDSETTDFASCVSSVKSSSSKTNEPLASAPSLVDFKPVSKTADQQSNSTNADSSFSFKENVKPPRNLCNKSGINSRSLCKRKSFGSKTCFVCGSKFHLIKDCDFYEKQLELHNKPMWTNVANIPSFVPKAASVPAGSRNRPTSVPAGSRNRPTFVPAGRPFTAGWKNHAARHMTRPSSHYFQHFSRPGYYNQMYMDEGRWGTAENPHKNRDLGIVDSGCSRSMTGNKEKLDDFVKIVGGTVTFGGGDGKITGKGTIRTSKLNFENVYYVEELQNFNLFYVSQICDTKNKVLFTDKECLVLSKEFQLPENSQVVLRVPRRNNLYCFNLSDIQPERDVTCLLAKASLDESTKWHRRMAHVNFKNMNKLAKHGLVNGLPSKLFTNEHNYVACNKGKQHKASYKAITAGIRRDYSNARTPQQNGVAERKNRTIIEAARTMLADSKLPTMFWTEAGDTACYCFGQEKQMKAFIVDKPNVQGLGHEWYFDLDYLTDSLGYTRFKTRQPAGTQDTNIHAGTQEDSDSECDEQVILVPSFPSNSFSGPKVHEASDMVESSSDYAEELARLQRQAFEANATAEKHLSQADLAASRNRVPTGKVVTTAGVSDGPTESSTPVFTPVHTDATSLPPGHSLGSSEHSSRYPSPSDLANSMSSFSEMEDIHHHSDTGIFSSSSYDDDFGGTVTNLAPSVVVDSVPTKRVNTIHLKIPITNTWGSHHLSDKRQTEIAKYSVPGNKAGWWAQGHRQEEGIDYDEVFALVARIEAIRLFLAFASYMGFMVYQMDVKSAFLYGRIEEEIYVTQPKWIEDPHFFPKHVYRDVESFVWSSSSTKAWDIILVQRSMWMTLCFGSTNKAWCDEFEVLMKGQFEMSAMGELTFFLGLQVKQEPGGIFISQDNFKADSQFAVSACSRHQVTPLTSNLNAVKKIN
ncbi:putative ribonuclease H-like domain-containing protein [Tanacetum coccineum]